MIRFVSPSAYVADAKAGERVLAAAIPTSDFTPNPTSYGASVFVRSRLPSGRDADYVVTKLGLKARLHARIPTGPIQALGIDVRFSPEDCADEELAPAHASLIGVDRKNRPALLKLIEAHLG